ncbi:TetR family transcriptional regulator C-terminal domain-containing protein [Kitasatospora sp. NPDC058397]|uniref:TetR family transcriptional regulator C-terminal domain-containing protein n=1 Tax=unclassified Kitasatospora TaxID=2633591 RepID=UPI0036608A10
MAGDEVAVLPDLLHLRREVAVVEGDVQAAVVAGPGDAPAAGGGTRPHPGRPGEQILGLARFIAEGLPAISHRGCPFINSIAELPDRSDPARQVIEEHKARQLRRLVAMCAEARLPDPAQTAAEITFVLEGAQVCAQNGSVDQAGERLMRIVEGIVSRS